MDIYLCLRECLKHFLSHCGIYLHGSHRIIFSGTSGIYFKGKVFVLIYIIDVLYNSLGKLIKALILMKLYRADSDNAKYSSECGYGLVIIVISVCFNIDTSAFFSNFEIAVYIF